MEIRLPNFPTRMYARPWSDGVRYTYRYHPKGGKPINLGTDLTIALAKAEELSGVAKPFERVAPSTVREMLERHRKGAKQRGIAFSLAQGDVDSVLERQGHRCAVTRLLFSLSKPAGLRVRPWLPSLDRKNCRLGYAPGNVRVVCAFVNVAMNGFGEELFREVLKALIEEAVQERLKDLGIPSGNKTSWESAGMPLRVDADAAPLSR